MMDVCFTAMCATPYIPNAEIVGGHRLNYRVNSIIEYKCSLGFEPEQPVQITCESKREWTGIQKCTGMLQLLDNLLLITLNVVIQMFHYPIIYIYIDVHLHN